MPERKRFFIRGVPLIPLYLYTPWDSRVSTKSWLLSLTAKWSAELPGKKVYKHVAPYLGSNTCIFIYCVLFWAAMQLKDINKKLWKREVFCVQFWWEGGNLQENRSWLQNHMQRLWRRSLVQVWRWDGKKSLYKRRRTCSRCGKKINWQAPVEAHYRQAQWCDGETNLFSIQDGWNSILQICSKKESKWRSKNRQPWPNNQDEFLQWIQTRNKHHDATSARSRSLESGLDGGSNGHPDDDEDLYIIGAVCMYVCMYVCQQKSLFVYSKIFCVPIFF